MKSTKTWVIKNSPLKIARKKFHRRDYKFLAAPCLQFIPRLAKYILEFLITLFDINWFKIFWLCTNWLSINLAITKSLRILVKLRHCKFNEFDAKTSFTNDVKEMSNDLTIEILLKINKNKFSFKSYIGKLQHLTLREM